MCDRALSAAFTDRSSRLCAAFGPPSSEPLTRPRGRHNGMLARWYLRLASVPRWRDQHSWCLGIWDCFSRHSRRSRCNVRPHLGPSGTRWGPSGVARAVHAAHAAHMLCPPGPLGHRAVPSRHAQIHQIVPAHPSQEAKNQPAASASNLGIWLWSRFQTGPVRQPPGPVGRPAGILAPCTKAVRSRRRMCQGGF